jgi:Ca-activated chloride channel family protein
MDLDRDLVVRGAVGIGLAAALAVAAPRAQVFRADIDLVSVGVTVVDREGRLITDLTREDFAVVEDGVPQTIRYFARGDAVGQGAPLHVGLLFDTSGSMGDDIERSRTAAIQFLNTLPDAEDLTLVEFDTEVRISRFSQDDFPRLVERIRGRRPQGFTALYDALGTYLFGASEIDGRKVLVLYTDGGDTRSSLSWSETLTLLKASDVTLYAVGFLGRQTSVDALQQRRRLEEMAAMTGGRAFFPRSARDVDAAYDEVLADLRAQYGLGYVSTNTRTDGGWRTVEVRLRRAGLERARIRRRSGYYARFQEPTP